MTRVLVTGATGFLGGRIARSLLERGDSLRLLHRPGRAEALSDAVPEGAGERAEAVEGDVTDLDSLQRAAEGCEAVVHAAARVSRSGSRADFEEVNLGGLECVLRAAEDSGVRRVVYTSSFFALGPSDGRAPRSEADLDEPVERELDHYQASKAKAARLALAESRAGRPLVTILPGAIVGPGPLTEGNFISGMIRDHLRRRPVPLPLGGRPQWSFVHVDDVAALHLAALDAEAPPPALCAGGANAGLAELFGEVARLTGRRPPRLSVPYAGLWLAGAGEELLELLFRRPPTQLTRGAASLLRHDWALDSSLAEGSLGWSARSLGATVHDTIAWMEGTRLLPAGTLREGAA